MNGWALLILVIGSIVLIITSIVSFYETTNHDKED